MGGELPLPKTLTSAPYEVEAEIARIADKLRINANFGRSSMWTITANILSKSLEQEYDTWVYNLEGAVSCASIIDKGDFDGKSVKLIIYGNVDTEEVIKRRRIPESIMSNDRIYSPEMGMSWMTFSDSFKLITIKTLLGKQNEPKIEYMLNESMHYPHLLFSTTINVNWDTDKNNRQGHRNSKEAFLRGGVAYAEGNSENGLVMRRP